MLNRIKQAMLAQLQTFAESEQRIVRICLTEQNVALPLLAWLKGQTIYPQFYFNFRNKKCACVALGQVRIFSDILKAQHFCQQEDLPLMGGCPFDGQAHFFLPRLFLLQDENTLQVQLFLDGAKPWAEEIKQAYLALSSFEHIQQTEFVPKICKKLGYGVEKADWCRRVEQALNAIQKQDFNKVVLANSQTFGLERNLHPCDFMAKSEQVNRHCYHFLFAENAHSSFVGSSPERLFLRCGQYIYTEALAGTAFVSDNEEETHYQAQWLLNDEKNLDENRLVVEHIQQSLMEITTNFRVGHCQIKRLRQVQHLQREITCQLNQISGDEACLSRIHPTAAVAGLPRSSAIHFIRINEPCSRGWYAGTLGIMGKTQSEFCVSIRSANIQKDIIQVFAGAGIVADSVPENEWDEIERKAQGLISLLEIAS